MSFFRRKDKNLIPPLEAEGASSTRGSSRSVSPLPPSYRSNASTYVPSRDGPDPYTYTGSRTNLQNTYDNHDSPTTKPPPLSDPALDRARGELFAGYKPDRAGSGRFFDGPDLAREPAPGEENDEDVEGIKQQTRFLKQESVNSTRNALRLAREAEETARGTLTRLGDQSEKLANTERHLDVAKGHTLRAEDQIDELKQLNKSIFRPVITWNKDAKRAAQEAKVMQRYDDERLEREKAMTDIRETQDRLGRAITYGQHDKEGVLGTGDRRTRTPGQLAAKKEQRMRYQFEAEASDDEIEDELDGNLDEISDVAKRLKALGTTMGQELDAQNQRLDVIGNKATELDNGVFRQTERVRDFAQPFRNTLTPYLAQEDQIVLLVLSGVRFFSCPYAVTLVTRI
ncbi:hypothetical protein PISMIDRAFT_90879 [Pisolithus microcarpus 441]|uniref:t-SNARE coiled-coil homology domain-containing protein n=1 Tax=Pisolithus microcarpus 441 TaxID=765257 RepID=A0A0D0A9C7_9AGAM|nr:hypothetical protein PISMIDRAFT_90879 [Pisolithus microcarpus 441]